MSDEEEGNGGHGFFWFVVGILCGIAAAIFVPGWAAPYIPSFLGGTTGVQGQVLDKVSETDRILVKVSTADGLILVTFTQNLKELDLLIGQGDSITLGLDGYEPLAENPAVSRVVGSNASGQPGAQPSRIEMQQETEEEPPSMEEMEETDVSADPGSTGGASMEAEPASPDMPGERDDSESEDDEAPETGEDVP